MSGAHQPPFYNNQQRAAIFNVNNSLYVQKNQQIDVISHPHCFVQTLLFLTQWYWPNRSNIMGKERKKHRKEQKKPTKQRRQIANCGRQ